ncbi:NAD(P)-dependent oxidoreductase [Staphylococcus epidermidis]|nr:NAD(P)-dependent oxidoreductase [Staphylococcus epidermidis]
MKGYLISGGSGMVGWELVKEIKERDGDIRILRREDKSCNDGKMRYMKW